MYVIESVGMSYFCADMRYQTRSFKSAQKKIHSHHGSQGTHGRHHGDSPMLQFHRSAALESGNVAIGSETYGVPEPNWRLHTEFILEGSGRNLSS